MTVRPLDANEMDAILPLYREGLERELAFLNTIVPGKTINEGGFPQLKNMLLQMMRENECRIFVAWENSQAIGYLLATKKAYPVENPKICGCINGIFVVPAKRGQGHARQLYDAAMAWFKFELITNVDLYYAINDSDAASFWHKLGFVPTQINCVKNI